MKKILIVDDDVDMVSYYRVRLSSDNYVVYYAKNPVEAHRVLGRNKIDLIICDYILNEETGLDFLRGIHEYYPEIPCIVLSNFKLDLDILEALNSKTIDMYLQKPLNISEMYNLIDRYVNLQ